jgi:hypothetical protein
MKRKEDIEDIYISGIYVKLGELRCQPTENSAAEPKTG